MYLSNHSYISIAKFFIIWQQYVLMCGWYILKLYNSISALMQSVSYWKADVVHIFYGCLCWRTQCVSNLIKVTTSFYEQQLFLCGWMHCSIKYATHIFVLWHVHKGDLSKVQFLQIFKGLYIIFNNSSIIFNNLQYIIIFKI